MRCLKITSNQLKNLKLIVGLGNPGEKYTNTRHNIGFIAIDKFHKKKFSDISWQQKYNAYFIKTKDLLLLKPLTYMNNSGKALINFVNFYKILIEDILIVFDDMDLEFGKIRFRKKGSSGGHRGVASIINSLKTENIQRIKIGIGRPSLSQDPANYVLQKFSKKEEKILDDIGVTIIEKIENWLDI